MGARNPCYTTVQNMDYLHSFLLQEQKSALHRNTELKKFCIFSKELFIRIHTQDIAKAHVHVQHHNNYISKSEHAYLATLPRCTITVHTTINIPDVHALNRHIDGTAFMVNANDIQVYCRHIQI